MKAREIVVLGTIHGNVETTDKIDIRKEAKLVGDIKTARIVIEDGAYFKGNIDIVRAEAAASRSRAPKPQPVASATAAPRHGGPHSVQPPLEAEISNASSLNLETRHSHGLDQFCASLEERPGLSILDLAGANQATVSFVTNYGHRLYSDDFVHQLDRVFRRRRFLRKSDQPAQGRSSFWKPRSTFRTGHFDGALVWDTLQFLSAPLLQIVVERLHRMLRPGACLLALFHAEETHRYDPDVFLPHLRSPQHHAGGARDAGGRRSSSTIAAWRNCSRISVGEIFPDARSSA